MGEFEDDQQAEEAGDSNQAGEGAASADAAPDGELEAAEEQALWPKAYETSFFNDRPYSRWFKVTGARISLSSATATAVQFEKEPPPATLNLRVQGWNDSARKPIDLSDTARTITIDAAAVNLSWPVGKGWYRFVGTTNAASFSVQLKGTLSI